MGINIKKNKRGFKCGDFVDRYGADCSIQKSSLAFEDCIWLGITDAKPVIMSSDAERLGLPTNSQVGWVDYQLPKEVFISTRMHLTKKQVKDLLPLLQQFVKTGNIE